MDRKVRDAAAILGVTEAAFAAAQARLATLARREGELRDMLAALRSPGTAAGGRDLTDAAHRAGADILWLRWADGRRSSLNAELARNLVAQMRAKSDLARSFGRSEAVRQVHETLRNRARAAAVRRAEREG